MSDLIVYGARCTWWNSISEVGRTPTQPSIPCCPKCGSVLFQAAEADWWTGVDRHEVAGNLGYRKLVEWSRGRCFPNYTAAKAAYLAREIGGGV